MREVAVSLPRCSGAREGRRCRAQGWEKTLAGAQSVRWTPASANLSFQHRRVQGGEIYLVANWKQRSRRSLLPHADLVPEIWDADTGNCLPTGQYRVEQGRTAVSLALHPHESAFVIFTWARPLLHAVRCEGGRAAYDADERLCVRLDASGLAAWNCPTARPASFA